MSSNFAQQNAKSKHMLKMLNLPLKELKLDAKTGGIKGYRSMSKDKLLSMVNTKTNKRTQNYQRHKKRKL